MSDEQNQISRLENHMSTNFEKDKLEQWFPKWAVPPPLGRWSRNGRFGGGETEMGSWEGDRRL